MIANAAFLFVGLVAGALHFALLRWNTALYLSARGVGRAAALQLGRLVALSGVLIAAALHGALPLLLAMLGVLIARPLVMRRMASTP